MQMSSFDFDQLWYMSTEWEGFPKRATRFECETEMNLTYKFCYWFDGGAELVLAKSYLAENGHAFQQLLDLVDGHHVLITDYPGNVHKMPDLNHYDGLPH